MDTSNLINRMIKASMLDVAFYNEVEHDTSLNQEALMVVIITAVASGIGGFLGGIFNGGIASAFLGLIVGVVMGIVGYYIWAYLTQWIGTKLFDGTAEVDELLRTLGYASAPRVLSVLSFIPCVGPLVALAGSLWSLVAGVIAVREALDFDTGKAVLTVVLGWVVVFVITAIVGVILGVGAAGLGALAGGLS